MQNLNFYTLNGTKITGSIKDIETIQNQQGISVFKTTLHFSFDDYQQIKNNSWFNHYPEVLNGSPVESFKEGKSLEVQLILRPTFMSVLEGKAAQDVFTLMQEENKKFAFLNQSESWLAYKILQYMSVPERTIGTLSLQLGYNTRFAVTPKKAETLSEVVATYLTNRGQKYEILENNVFKFFLKTDKHAWGMLISVKEEQKQCLVYSILPTLVPENKRVEIAGILMHVNSELGIGSYEMNMKNGETRYRTSIDVNNYHLSNELFANTLRLNIRTFNFYLASILSKIGESKKIKSEENLNVVK